MTILELLDSLPLCDIVTQSPDFDTSMPCHMPCRDARRVTADDVFFAVRGTHFDGHNAIPEAAARGAALVVLDDIRYADTCPTPWICVRDAAQAFLPACLSCAHHPERGMSLYAVTGTNGKTSITYLLEAIFSQNPAYAPCAVIGTVENRIAGEILPASRTTPPPEELCALLCRARDAGVKTVILEASSHALAQGRLSGLHFSAGIFTNLTEDHLDYHKSMEAYFHCKRSLFFSCDTAVLNIDDPYGRRLYADDAIPAKKIGYSLSDCGADWFAKATQNKDGCHLLLLSKENTPLSLYSSLRGSFAAPNITASCACAYDAGISPTQMQAGLCSLDNIPGRMECIVSSPYAVFLDYAHTPDALSRAILSVREHCRSAAVEQNVPAPRTLVLFGCGGDREHEKRPKMGKIAASLADITVITSDNSRSEDPIDIINAILAGIPDRKNVIVIPDRRRAIEEILDMAQPGDCILLAGKGHENYQIDKTGTHPFSEREIVLSHIQKQTH
ncbi:MAG: UDP-N-acetylmuramoyl-L-alanyl-D-glutamate--2,6-diaminopimelate ligase [Clostridia bacterium]|nr:UDP-N-acetylmuramoyl-L-alanyl-D-glutamate--2,6-diaminopimelate ligase [Clostridia bacterium]